MKRLFTLLCSLLALATGVQADEITGFKLSLIVDGEAFTQEMPVSGFETVDLTDRATNSLIIDGVNVTTTGNVSDVYVTATMYEQGEQPLPENWRGMTVPSLGGGQWGASNLSWELVEGNDEEVKVFEFYAGAKDGAGNDLFYNNGGENYKVVFTKAENDNWNIKFYKANTATLTLAADGSPRTYTYNGDMERDDDTMPGELTSLRIDAFSVWFVYNSEKGISTNDVSLQYKVYEDGTDSEAASWNRLDATSLVPSTHFNEEKNRMDYRLTCSASGLNREVAQGLTPGKNYVLEVAYQVVDNNNDYRFLGKDHANSRFYFSIPGDSATDIIQFADAEVKRICVKKWDKNGDGELSMNEAAAVTELGQVFEGNQSITSFDEFQYFTGVTSIGDGAFAYCSSLTSIEIPAGVTSIGDGAFWECSSLTSIEIPAGVTSIGDNAFANCSSLTSIEIPAGVTSIGWYAFAGCSSLTSIEIPAGVTSIGEGAFASCSSLTSIVVANGNAVYDSRDNCNAIIETSTNTLVAGCQTTVIPNSVTSIGSHAFYGCSSLTSIEIPAGVTSIGNWAFESCSSLTSIEIPAGVTSIGESAFASCSSLTSIVVANGNAVYDSRDNCNAIIETSTNTLVAGCQTTVIPNSVTSIGDSAFEGCSSLTSIEIPAGVTSIGRYAFNRCSSLTSIEIPAGVTSIGQYAFEYCSSLTSITCYIQEPFTIDSGVFYDVPSTSILYVPKGTKALYEATEGWKDFPGTIVEMGGEDLAEYVDEQGVRYMPFNNEAYVVEGYTEQLVADVTLPAEIEGYPVVAIQEHAFRDATVLKSIVIPESITEVGIDVFMGATNLLVVEWNSPARVSSDCFDAPEACGNLLVYVNSDAEVRYQGNVIRNGETGTLTLKDYRPLRVPTSFHAEKVSLTREFTKASPDPTQGGENLAAGWEGMILPFDVQTITYVPRDFRLKPFGANGAADARFWLAGENENDNDNENGIAFTKATEMKANVPYILSMPNNEHYVSWQNIEGAVTFAADNVQVMTTDLPNDSTEQILSLAGAYEPVAASDISYALNEQAYTADGKTFPAGGVFVRNSREVRPFEAYVKNNDNENDNNNGGGAKPRYIPIRTTEGDATDIASLLIGKSSSLSLEGEASVYDLSGRIVATCYDEFLRRQSELNRGVYLYKNRKILLK